MGAVCNSISRNRSEKKSTHKTAPFLRLYVKHVYSRQSVPLNPECGSDLLLQQARSAEHARGLTGKPASSVHCIIPACLLREPHCMGRGDPSWDGHGCLESARDRREFSE